VHVCIKNRIKLSPILQSILKIDDFFEIILSLYHFIILSLFLNNFLDGYLPLIAFYCTFT